MKGCWRREAEKTWYERLAAGGALDYRKRISAGRLRCPQRCGQTDRLLGWQKNFVCMLEYAIQQYNPQKITPF